MDLPKRIKRLEKSFIMIVGDGGGVDSIIRNYSNLLSNFTCCYLLL